MIMGTVLKRVYPFVPVVGSAYGFTKTCGRVYNATSPTKAVIDGVKRIVIDLSIVYCSPPVVKYPLLCAAAIVTGE